MVMIELLIQLGIVVLALALGAVIGAVFLQYIAKLVVKFKPPYGMAYKAVFIAGAVSVMVGLIFGFGLGVSGYENVQAIEPLMWPIGLVIATYVYGRVLAHPDTGPIGFGKAFMIWLTWLAIFVSIVLISALVELL